MVKFYYLSGSRHSCEAEILLQERKLPFEKIDVLKSNIIANINCELGIRRLPAILHNGSRYEGIKEIRIFVEQR